jgi:N-acyl-L-homoserine lactone synthetase
MDLSQREFYFKTAETEKELHMCYQLRYQVYCLEKHWLAPSDFIDGLEYDQYDSSSIHVMAMDADFNLVGVMRILRKENYLKLPYENHPGIKGISTHLPNSAELSRFIVSSEKNRYHITRGLLRAVYQTSVKIGIENWIFMIEPSLLRLLGIYRFYLSPLGKPSLYFGAFTMVAKCNIAYTESIWKTRDKEVWAFNTQEAVMMSLEDIRVEQ